MNSWLVVSGIAGDVITGELSLQQEQGKKKRKIRDRNTFVHNFGQKSIVRI